MVKKELYDELEDLFGEAYEIGHAHGRMDEKFINIGWHKPFKKAMKKLKEFIKKFKEEVKDDSARAIMDKLAGEKLA